MFIISLTISKKKSLNVNTDDGDALKLITIANVKAGFTNASEVASRAKVLVLVFSNKLTCELQLAVWGEVTVVCSTSH